MDVFKCRNVGGRLMLSSPAMKMIYDVLTSGGLVVYPTETVYGIGADPFQEAAVKKVFRVKRRPRCMPLSMAVQSTEALWSYALPTDFSLDFCRKILPGPITVLLRATSTAPPSMVSEEGLIGFRVPDHPVAAQVLKVFSPLTATSANRHNRPPPVTCEEAIRQLGEGVEVYIDAGRCRYGKESTVVDLSAGKTSIIRSGALSRKELSDAARRVGQADVGGKGGRRRSEAGHKPRKGRR